MREGANIQLRAEDISFAGLCELESEWRSLLAADDPRLLSASSTWIKTWWGVYEPVLQDSAWRGIAIKGSTGDLLGLALFYLHGVSSRGVKLQRLEMVGQYWRSGLGPRSEYGGIIARPEHIDRVTELVFEHLAAWTDWDEMIIGNTIQDSSDAAIRSQLAASRGWYRRTHETGNTFAMKLGGDLESYRAALPGKFRQRVFNHRKKLEKQGRVVSRSADSGETDQFLEILNQFHQKRWGKPVFTAQRLEFHQALTRQLLTTGELYLNVLEVDDRPVSLLYDIVSGTTKYGFQLGFDSEFDTKVSLFSVHLGFSIEDAFERRLTRFDMLRGHGRSGRDYKERVAAPFHETASEQYIRSSGLRGAARAYDFLKSIARLIKR